MKPVEKKAWTKPMIEKIKLEFDKEMSWACYGSSDTVKTDGSCGAGASGTCFKQV